MRAYLLEVRAGNEQFVLRDVHLVLGNLLDAERLVGQHVDAVQQDVVLLYRENLVADHF